MSKIEGISDLATQLKPTPSSDILILGGTGLIGCALLHYWNVHCPELRVRVVVRSAKRTQTLPSGIVDVVEFSQMKDSDWIASTWINLAGAPIAGVRWTDSSLKEIQSSRVEFTKSLVAKIRSMPSEHRPLSFLQGSAVGYYGSYRSEHPAFGEDSSAGRGFLAKLCVDWEEASQPLSDMGIRLIRLRTGIVLSRNGGALAKMLPPFLWGAGGSISPGTQMMSWIALDDMVSAVEFLRTHKEAEGAFNLSAPHPVTNQVFSQTLAKVLRRPAFFTVPEFAMKSLFGEGAQVVTEGQNVIPQKLIALGFSFQFPDIEPALQKVL